MEIYTIGFTQRCAEEFFEPLRQAAIRRLIDVRLNNRSQLAGFAKRDDLAYFLSQLCNIEYHHEPLLAPTPEMLDAYRKKELAWDVYEQQFKTLLVQRRVEQKVTKALFDKPVVLLCSERSPEHCHRRLVAEYLCEQWGGGQVIHL